MVCLKMLWLYSTYNSSNKAGTVGNLKELQGCEMIMDMKLRIDFWSRVWIHFASVRIDFPLSESIFGNHQAHGSIDIKLF